MSADDEDVGNSVPNNVEIETGIEEVDEEEFVVHRTAAFAELADRPKRKAIDEEKAKGEVKFFDDLRAFDAELAGTIHAQSQSAASGVDASHPAEADVEMEMSDEERKVTQACRDLLRDLGIKQDALTIFRDLISHGNDVSWIEMDDEEGVTDLRVLPLRALTILDEQTYENRGPNQSEPFISDSDSGKNFDRVIQDADYYVINEGDEENEQAYREHEVLHIALNKRRNWHKDRKGRWTFSVWGERRLEPTRYSLQAKQNTLANKVAMDDKLLAREFYKVNVAELFGHIEDPDRRQKKAEEYADELRQLLEGLEADQKPILPEEVDVIVEGPDGDTARNMSNFIQTMNDSLQHALTYHVASFGRDAGGTDRGNRPAKEMSDNSVRQLRNIVKHSFQYLFEVHTILKFPEYREVADDSFDDDDIRRYKVNDDITLPTLEFDPVDPTEQSEKVRDAISLYEKGVADLNEARAIVGLDPLGEQDIEDRWFLKNPTTKEEDIEMELEEQDDGNTTDDDDGDGGDSSGNRRSYPTDSGEWP